MMRPKSEPVKKLDRNSDEVPGIVIHDRSGATGSGFDRPRVRAFVYGETLPSLPVLPYGRWKAAS
jgi:hypothetical protein